MTKTSTTSECRAQGSIIGIITGVVALAGVTALLWVVLAPHAEKIIDPQGEVDRRIGELENSLRHLHDALQKA